MLQRVQNCNLHSDVVFEQSERLDERFRHIALLDDALVVGERVGKVPLHVLNRGRFCVELNDRFTDLFSDFVAGYPHEVT